MHWKKIHFKFYIFKFCAIFEDFSSVYTKLDKRDGIDSKIVCGSLVLNTWVQTTAKSRANAFWQQGTSCEIGRVSPFYGNGSIQKGSNFGHLLLGCSGKCKSINKLFGKK